MVLFIVEMGISETFQEQDEMSLDSIYRSFFGNDVDMYQCIIGYVKLQRKLRNS